MSKIVSITICCWLASSVHADEVSIAVAANFQQPMQQIARAFEQTSGHRVIISTGATGKLYAQIVNGAPFEVLLAADNETPERLEKEGLAEPGRRFTYAIGRLILWSAKPNGVDTKGEILRTGDFQHLAVANPKLAPYGRAAMETLQALGIANQFTDRSVTGESIAQTHQFIATGNADLGFVAMSQVYEQGKLVSGSAWLVPDNLHHPIRQDAVLLKKGNDRPAAKALLQYLRADAARKIISSYGYSW
ncbi:molybdate ABC transporter substrate-binding protein [Chitinimonas sp. BJB300]|uniref:molybdate ABC transporter substrate-binding protein n=1 Tax=Chitinimonas sp. BJB300 TaxID=1559339 RepID=UPI000C0DAF9A|nr:molybdate ABC transporter substrate-binding protein [Chitinimonas sp. BJB300]PHV11124.1 molybdate ABC transporter substrate-binding protein [Chitinimonas sp. BJB300]TSJ90988.1 molybdate ABC transporter substrate-binding protein [Chitinimonas sp. BJB300]